MDASPRLRLGPRVLSFLVDKYKSWNQSVENFISGIKVFAICMWSINIVRLHVSFLCEPVVASASFAGHR